MIEVLRGEYGEARRLYQLARERSQAAGDEYHSALCDLDEAEMYLELNLTREGEPMARRAVDALARMGMLYEQAKALVNLAVAASRRNDYRFSDKAFLHARRLFVREKNPVWPALVDPTTGGAGVSRDALRSGAAAEFIRVARFDEYRGAGISWRFMKAWWRCIWIRRSPGLQAASNGRCCWSNKRSRAVWRTVWARPRMRKAGWWRTKRGSRRCGVI